MDTSAPHPARSEQSLSDLSHTFAAAGSSLGPMAAGHHASVTPRTKPLALPPAPPNSADALRNKVAHSFHEFCHGREWVREYLLDASADATLSVLSDDRARRWTVTSSNSWKGVGLADAEDDSCAEVGAGAGVSDGPSCERPLASVTSPYDFHEHAEFCLTPHIAFGDISAGVLVSRHWTLSLDQDPPEPGEADSAAAEYRVGRYVRDESKGNLLAVEQSYGVAATGPTGSTSSRSGAQRHGFFLACNGTTTRRERLYFTLDESAYDMWDFPKCVKWVAASYEQRSCVLCGQRPTASCGCVLPVFRPSHVTDWTKSGPAMLLQVGKFVGRSRRMHDLGGNKVSEPLVTREEICGFSPAVPNLAIAHSILEGLLKSFAVQLCLRERTPERRFSGVLPFGPVDNQGSLAAGVTQPGMLLPSNQKSHLEASQVVSKLGSVGIVRDKRKLDHRSEEPEEDARFDICFPSSSAKAASGSTLFERMPWRGAGEIIDVGANKCGVPEAELEVEGGRPSPERMMLKCRPLGARTSTFASQHRSGAAPAWPATTPNFARSDVDAVTARITNRDSEGAVAGTQNTSTTNLAAREAQDPVLMREAPYAVATSTHSPGVQGILAGSRRSIERRAGTKQDYAIPEPVGDDFCPGTESVSVDTPPPRNRCGSHELDTEEMPNPSVNTNTFTNVTPGADTDHAHPQQSAVDSIRRPVKQRRPTNRTPEEEAARELKRKIKNRESAARANMRRKLKNDYMKSELETTRKRLIELLQREAELRQERGKLKARLCLPGELDSEWPTV